MSVELVPPVTAYQELELDIVEEGKKGDGVARIGDTKYVVFVAGTKPGDRVKVRIKHVLARYAVAEVVS